MPNTIKKLSVLNIPKSDGTLQEYEIVDASARTGLQNKQNTLTFDSTPTANSTNPITSGGVYTAISNIPIENSDWSENDPTSKSYVENRTHYVERIPLTEVLTYSTEDNNTPYQISYPDAEWNKSLNEGDAYSLTLNGTIFTGNIKIINVETENYYYLGNASLPSMGEDTGESYFLIFYSNYNMVILFLSEAPSSGLNMSLSLTSSIIHKLDSKYLDGSLILSGEKNNSEIFNGESSVLISYIRVSGNAGSTSYTFYSENYLQSLKYIYDKVTIKGYEDVSIIGYSFDESNSIGTLTLSKTLDENNNLNSQSIPLIIPTKIGLGAYSHIEGVSGWTFGDGSHAEGCKTVAISYCSHAEGFGTVASNIYSHAEGYSTTASGKYSHAEGSNTIASGEESHAEGSNTIASNENSHAEGRYTKASGMYSHAEGNGTIASGQSSHTEGESTTASAYCSHTEGLHSIASAYYSHAEGRYTTARGRSQHVFGEYNISDGDETTSNNNKAGKYVEIVGNGTSDSARSNAHTLDWSGNAWYSGTVTADGTPTNDNDLVSKKWVEDKGYLTKHAQDIVSSVNGKTGTITLTAEDVGAMEGMTILSYGHSTWDEFLEAYEANRIVYCKASTNSDPSTGQQGRMAFFAFIQFQDQGYSTTKAEFQYYRSVKAHTDAQQGDQVFCYSLSPINGGTWSVEVRQASSRVVAGTGLASAYTKDKLTLSLDADYKNKIDALWTDYQSAITAIGI